VRCVACSARKPRVRTQKGRSGATKDNTRRHLGEASEDFPSELYLQVGSNVRKQLSGSYFADSMHCDRPLYLRQDKKFAVFWCGKKQKWILNLDGVLDGEEHCWNEQDVFHPGLITSKWKVSGALLGNQLGHQLVDFMIKGSRPVQGKKKRKRNTTKNNAQEGGNAVVENRSRVKGDNSLSPTSSSNRRKAKNKTIKPASAKDGVKTRQRAKLQTTKSGKKRTKEAKKTASKAEGGRRATRGASTRKKGSKHVEMKDRIGTDKDSSTHEPLDKNEEDNDDDDDGEDNEDSREKNLSESDDKKGKRRQSIREDGDGGRGDEAHDVEAEKQSKPKKKKKQFVSSKDILSKFALEDDDDEEEDDQEEEAKDDSNEKHEDDDDAHVNEADRQANATLKVGEENRGNRANPETKVKEEAKPNLMLKVTLRPKSKRLRKPLQSGKAEESEDKMNTKETLGSNNTKKAKNVESFEKKKAAVNDLEKESARGKGRRETTVALGAKNEEGAKRTKTKRKLPDIETEKKKTKKPRKAEGGIRNKSAKGNSLDNDHDGDDHGNTEACSASSATEEDADHKEAEKEHKGKQKVRGRRRTSMRGAAPSSLPSSSTNSSGRGNAKRMKTRPQTSPVRRQRKTRIPKLASPDLEVASKAVDPEQEKLKRLQEIEGWWKIQYESGFTGYYGIHSDGAVDLRSYKPEGCHGWGRNARIRVSKATTGSTGVSTMLKTSGVVSKSSETSSSSYANASKPTSSPSSAYFFQIRPCSAADSSEDVRISRASDGRILKLVVQHRSGSYRTKGTGVFIGELNQANVLMIPPKRKAFSASYQPNRLPLTKLHTPTSSAPNINTTTVSPATATINLNTNVSGKGVGIHGQATSDSIGIGGSDGSSGFRSWNIKPRVYVQGIPTHSFLLIEPQLRNHFGQFGPISEIYIKDHNQSFVGGKPRNTTFALVYYQTVEAADKALAAGSRAWICGAEVTVRNGQPKPRDSVSSPYPPPPSESCKVIVVSNLKDTRSQKFSVRDMLLLQNLNTYTPKDTSELSKFFREAGAHKIYIQWVGGKNDFTGKAWVKVKPAEAAIHAYFSMQDRLLLGGYVKFNIRPPFETRCQAQYTDLAWYPAKILDCRRSADMTSIEYKVEFCGFAGDYLHLLAKQVRDIEIDEKHLLMYRPLRPDSNAMGYKMCHAFRNTGTCRAGNHCKYIHDTTGVA